MSHFTISGAHRVELCPPSAVLPAVRNIEEVPARTEGTIMHAYLLDVATMGRDEALAAAPMEHREALELIPVGRMPCEAEAYAHEVAFAYDTATDKARELHRGRGDRDYSGTRPTEICGTADVVGMTPEKVLVYDYKKTFRHLGDPARSLQLRAYALAAARAWGRSAAVVGFIRVNPSTSEPFYTEAQLDAIDLDETAMRLTQTWEIVQSLKIAGVDTLSPADITIGRHCEWCPAYGTCPGQVSFIRALVADLAAAHPEHLDVPLNEMTHATVLERLEAFERAAEHMRGKLKAYAKVTPIPIGDGRVYGEARVDRELIDPTRGAAVLGDVFGAKVAVDAVETRPSLTKASLGRALRAWMTANKGHRISKLEHTAMSHLREAGAVHVSSTLQVKVHKPKEEQREEAPEEAQVA